MFKHFILISLFMVSITIKGEPLANRFYVKNFLLAKFGKHLEPLLDETIIKNISIFNGPCDIYGQVVVEEKSKLKEVYPEATCYSDISQSKVDMNGKKSTLRKAWILKTCLTISKNEESIKEVSSQDRQKYVESFFSYKEDYKDFIKSFDIKSSKTSELILKLCTNQRWQRI